LTGSRRPRVEVWRSRLVQSPGRERRSARGRIRFVLLEPELVATGLVSARVAPAEQQPRCSVPLLPAQVLAAGLSSAVTRMPPAQALSRLHAAQMAARPERLHPLPGASKHGLLLWNRNPSEAGLPAPLAVLEFWAASSLQPTRQVLRWAEPAGRDAARGPASLVSPRSTTPRVWRKVAEWFSSAWAQVLPERALGRGLGVVACSGPP
jgi:hypothetical protein